MSNSEKTFSSRFIASTVNTKFCDKWRQNNFEIASESPAFLSSFPRSGNGWVRLVLSGILLEINGINIDETELTLAQTTTGFKHAVFQTPQGTFAIEDIFPDMYLVKGKTGPLYPDAIELTFPRTLLKTHHLVDCAQCPVIFLFREPLSCLTSAASFLNAESIAETPKAINETMLYLAGYYKQFLSTYLAFQASHPANCFMLSNASLRTDNAAEQFAAVMKFIGISVELDIVQKVITKFPLISSYNKQLEDSILEFTRKKIEVDLERDYQLALSISHAAPSQKAAAA